MKHGHLHDRIAVARAVRYLRNRGSQNFTPREYRVQLHWYIQNNLARLTRARRLKEAETEKC